MKFKFLLIVSASISLLASSCIKSEGMDREADMLKISMVGDENYSSTIYQEGARLIYLVMKDTTGMKKASIAPIIELSKGANVSPASGETVTLDEYRTTYLVRSEDGSEKAYLVIVSPHIPLIMDFEDWYVPTGASPKRQYELPVDALWINANAGVSLLFRDDELFPTRSSTDVRPGSGGLKSVELATVFGNHNPIVDMMNIPVFAGNMFMGVFNAKAALGDPLSATKFGQIYPEHEGKALRLKAWYKYKPGEEFTTWEYTTSSGRKTKVISIDPNRVDELDLYAVLYRTPEGKGNEVFLTGHDINNSESIVAIAKLEDKSEKSEWTEIDIPFVYIKHADEPLDYKSYDYKLAVVLSSSSDGANYKGAIGSVLNIDDLEIVTENSAQKKQKR